MEQILEFRGVGDVMGSQPCPLGAVVLSLQPCWAWRFWLSRANGSIESHLLILIHSLIWGWFFVLSGLRVPTHNRHEAGPLCHTQSSLLPF